MYFSCENCFRVDVLVGTIPNVLGSLVSLTDLELHSNCLTGLCFLNILDMPFLKFGLGTIPNSLGLLGKLRILYLSANSLNGDYLFIYLLLRIMVSFEFIRICSNRFVFDRSLGQFGCGIIRQSDDYMCCTLFEFCSI